MNGVLGFSEVLLADELTAKQRRQVEMIADSGRAMLRLLNDILDMSKIEAGHMTFAPGNVDLSHMLNSVTRMMQPSADAKKLELDIFIAPGLPQNIVTDPLRLRQILINLLSNAIKFTERGHVHILAHMQTENQKSFLQFSIVDSGIGMAPDRLEAIFAPFMQAERDTSHRFGGTGLGLSISQELARLLGGSISVISQEHVGSTFTLTLPLSAEVAQVSAPEPDDIDIQKLALSNIRILLAEDNDINQELMRDMSAPLGLDLQIVPDGEQAIEAVRQAARTNNGFSIVFMDLRMPGIGGLEATRRLRDLGYGPDELPIIALTANAYRTDIDACMKAGMQGHLSKPLRLRDFKEALAKYCGDIDGDQSQPKQSATLAQKDLFKRFENRKHELFTAIEQTRKLDVISADDVDALTDKLHKIAGTAGVFGEDELGDAAAQLEQALRAARPDQIAIILENADLLLSDRA